MKFFRMNQVIPTFPWMPGPTITPLEDKVTITQLNLPFMPVKLLLGIGKINKKITVLFIFFILLVDEEVKSYKLSMLPYRNNFDENCTSCLRKIKTQLLPNTCVYTALRIHSNIFQNILNIYYFNEDTLNNINNYKRTITPARAPQSLVACSKRSVSRSM
uniref:Uncharacterized protein n=1 Tax=Heterorhabditis bacteriophora TaxID=37862 RepID=A0A1I7W6S4_HETBA